MVGTVRSTLAKLGNACNALPNFHTLQIVYLSHSILTIPTRKCWRCPERRQNVRSTEQIQDMDNWAIDCFMEAETGSQEGGPRQKTTFRFIELGPVLADTQPDVDIPPMFYLGSVKVKEYGVQGFDGSGPQRVRRYE